MDPIFHADISAEIEKIRPLGDFLLVRRIPEEQISTIILAPKTREMDTPGLRRGIVIACGPGDKLPGSEQEPRRAEMNVKPGDTVIYTRTLANLASINGDEYVFLHEEQHVYAVLEEAA